MFEYTKNNHFKFGYNNINKYQDRVTADDQFTSVYGAVVTTKLSWRESNLMAARQIFANRVGEIYILLSGGMDSEICLRSFLEQEIPVKTITLRFTDVDQTNEQFFINKLVKNFNLKHEYVDLNLTDFINSQDFNQTIDPIKCVSPIIGCHLWLANQITGTPIIAQGEVHLKKEIPHDYVPGVSTYVSTDWYLFESERLCSIYQNFIKLNKPAIPGFFQYLPEQIYSFLKQNPYLEKLITNQIYGKLGTRSSKNIMSAQFYPEIELRTKLHGWEPIQDFHDEHRSQLAKKFPDNDSYYKIKYSHAVEQLSPSP